MQRLNEETRAKLALEAGVATPAQIRAATASPETVARAREVAERVKAILAEVETKAVG